MLRKDMVLKLVKLLNNLDGVCTNKVKADVILAEMEKLGMAPPATTKYKKYPVMHEGQKGILEHLTEVNEWEN